MNMAGGEKVRAGTKVEQKSGLLKAAHAQLQNFALKLILTAIASKNANISDP